MFLKNKYSLWYFNIVENAKNRIISGYVEHHHIIPRGAGGSDDSNNIVKLTAKEHFVCHLLLTKCTRGKIKYKMMCAVNKMLSITSKQERYIPASTRYQRIREEFAKAHSTYMSGKFIGKDHHSFGKVRSIEYRKKISNSLLGRTPTKKTCEHCFKEVSPGPYKKYHGDKCKKNKNITLSDLNSRKKVKKNLCVHCNKLIEAGAYGRWHGDNCKVLKAQKKMKTKKIQIKNLEIGMKVKTKNEQGEIVFKTVTDKWNTIVPTEDQVRLEFENGVILNCSVNHPIMCCSSTGEFLQKLPKELTNDDLVLSETGFTRLLVADFDQSNNENYIDITVDDTHTFFASANKEGPMVLTHNSQGGIRNASATITYPIWHYQFDDLIVLKNNQGTEETRVRHLDYSVVISKLFWRRFKNRENITLFDPNEVPDMYEAFYSDIDKFEELYVANEKRNDLRKKVISAEEIFKGGILKERTDTGRIYLVFIDNVQKQGPFDTAVDPIYQSNLCQEILLPTTSFKRLDDPEGRIALCTLGSLNWGAFRNPEDMRRAARILHRSLNNILDYQDFLSVHSKMSNEEIRPLGIGVTNLAYWHAKRNLKYGETEALAEVKSWMEHQAFYLTEASVELAKERGKCLHSDRTRYGQGVFPWELRAEASNELTDFTPELDWESLRAQMKEHGVRNATVCAIAPVESSSVVINSTNGIEMPMSLISTKESKAGSFTQVVPEYHKLKNKYQLMWEQPDCIGYLKTAAVLAAYIDQSISTNTFYNPAHFEGRKVPTTLIAKNLMQAQRWGIKSFYYSLVNKQGAKVQDSPEDKPLEAIDFDDESGCESCKL